MRLTRDLAFQPTYFHTGPSHEPRVVTTGTGLGQRPAGRGIAQVDGAKPTVVGRKESVAGPEREGGMPDGVELAEADRDHRAWPSGATTSPTSGGAANCSTTRPTGRPSVATWSTPRRSAPRRSGPRSTWPSTSGPAGPPRWRRSPHDVAMIVAMEIAQIALLEEFFGVPVREARLSFGYSIGELTRPGRRRRLHDRPAPARPAGAGRRRRRARPRRDDGRPLHQGPRAAAEDVERLCLAVSSEGRGLIGPSAFLSPNTALLLGQGDTLDRLEAHDARVLPRARSCSGASRTGGRRCTRPWSGSGTSPTGPPSPCTGSRAAGQPVAPGHLVRHRRGELRRPQQPRAPRPLDRRARNGSGTSSTRRSPPGVEVVVHVGPAPNLIPATFARLGNNVSRQLDEQVRAPARPRGRLRHEPPRLAGPPPALEDGPAARPVPRSTSSSKTGCSSRIPGSVDSGFGRDRPPEATGIGLAGLWENPAGSSRYIEERASATSRRFRRLPRQGRPWPDAPIARTASGGRR